MQSQAANMRKGYLTVFLSLTITIMMSLILALFQSARIGAIKLQAECAADIAMNSILAEYDRALFEQYDLLLVDCSYQTATPSIANVEEHLRYFTQGNYDRSVIGRFSGVRSMTSLNCERTQIPAYSFATDGNAAVLRRQILAYMEGEPVMDALAEATANLGVLSANGYDTHDVEAEAAENRERLDQMMQELPEQEDAEGNEDTPILDNPADAVETQKGIGVANLAVPNPASISTASVDLSQFCSHRDRNKGTGLDDGESLSLMDRLLVRQYMLEKTGCYTKPREGSVLKYQLEYLIGGESGDFENLEHCARILLFWREAADFAYLISDQTKVGEVEVLATILALLALMPELEEPIKWSILFAWSFAEAISDLRTLYEGGKVPLIKSADTWQLSLANLAFFRDHLGGGGDEGLTYQDYLRMLLLLGDFEEETWRMADIIEMQIRKTPGNGNFRLDWCLDIFQAEIDTRSRFGFDVQLVRTYGYEKR